MHHPFAPLTVLLLCPLLYAGASLGLQRRAAFRWAVLAVAAAIVAIGCQAGGVDFLYLNRMKLFLAAATAVWVLFARTGDEPTSKSESPGEASPPVTRHPSPVTSSASPVTAPLPFPLLLLALLSVPVYLNFLSFHGTGATRVYVHLHDVAHYYLGSKYFAELGYGDLYTAMLRAEAESYDNRFRAIEARDLRSNALVHIRVLLQQSEPVKARFGPERWADFRRDVAWFRDTLGPQYGEVLKDHGFNPTPVWALLGGPIAGLVPAGSGRGILALALLDLGLLAVMFATIGRTFGSRALLLCLIYFCLPFGASFGWTGGGFLRFLWLTCVVTAVCGLERQRHALAGVLLALATMLRVFPAAFALALGLRAVAVAARERRLDPGHLRFFVAFTVVAVVLFGATLLRSNGWQHWLDFRANMQSHLQSAAFNTIGLNEVVAYAGPTKPDTPEDFAAETARRAFLYRVQLATAFAATLLAVLAWSRGAGDARAAAMGVLLLFSGLTLASYYWIFLLLLVALRHGDRRALTFLFGAEAVMYALTLFEEREVVLYFYKNLLVGGTLAALYFEPLRALAARRAEAHAA